MFNRLNKWLTEGDKWLPIGIVVGAVLGLFVIGQMRSAESKEMQISGNCMAYTEGLDEAVAKMNSDVERIKNGEVASVGGAKTLYRYWNPKSVDGKTTPSEIKIVGVMDGNPILGFITFEVKDGDLTDLPVGAAVSCFFPTDSEPVIEAERVEIIDLAPVMDARE